MTCDEVRDLAPLYAAGALGPAEEAAVREHMLTCPLAHDEIAEFGAAAQALLETVEPAEPSAGLRERILAAAAADLAEGRHPAASAPIVSTAAAAPIATTAAASLQRQVPAPIAIASRRHNLRLWVALAVAAVVIVVLGGAGLRLQRELDSAQAYRDGIAAALSLAIQPGSQTVLLAADDGSVSGLGVVGADGTVKIAMRGLPETTGSQVYTAWSIRGSDAPVPIGEFPVSGAGTAVVTAYLQQPAPGVVLALTLEPHAGATTPTLPIVAKGVARPATG
jgi:hypothetical protein